MMESPHPDCMATHIPDPQTLERLAEEGECAHRYLDQAKMPRADIDGTVYSLVKRIQLFSISGNFWRAIHG